MLQFSIYTEQRGLTYTGKPTVDGAAMALIMDGDEYWSVVYSDGPWVVLQSEDTTSTGNCMPLTVVAYRLEPVSLVKDEYRSTMRAMWRDMRSMDRWVKSFA